MEGGGGGGGGGASSISYIQNRHSQGVGLHPDHIFIIGVVRGGGFIHIIFSECLNPYDIFTIRIVRGGGGFIHIIYSE